MLGVHKRIEHDADGAAFGTATIKDERSFEAYPWIGPQNGYYRDVDLIRDHLKEAA